jgi:hypothetical protein
MVLDAHVQYSSSPVGVRESLAYGLVQQYKQDYVHDG